MGLPYFVLGTSTRLRNPQKKKFFEGSLRLYVIHGNRVPLKVKISNNIL